MRRQTSPEAAAVATSELCDAIAMCVRMQDWTRAQETARDAWGFVWGSVVQLLQRGAYERRGTPPIMLSGAWSGEADEGPVRRDVARWRREAAEAVAAVRMRPGEPAVKTLAAAGLDVLDLARRAGFAGREFASWARRAGAGRCAVGLDEAWGWWVRDLCRLCAVLDRLEREGIAREELPPPREQDYRPRAVRTQGDTPKKYAVV